MDESIRFPLDRLSATTLDNVGMYVAVTCEFVLLAHSNVCRMVGRISLSLVPHLFMAATTVDESERTFTCEFAMMLSNICSDSNTAMASLAFILRRRSFRVSLRCHEGWFLAVIKDPAIARSEASVTTTVSS